MLSVDFRHYIQLITVNIQRTRRVGTVIGYLPNAIDSERIQLVSLLENLR